MHDCDEDVRSYAAYALWQWARGTTKETLVKEALKKVAAEDESDYVRDSAQEYWNKFDQE